MIWIAPSEKKTGRATLEKPLWDAADTFRASSGRKSWQHSAHSSDKPRKPDGTC
jgi:type I restriction enzyme M protein